MSEKEFKILIVFAGFVVVTLFSGIYFDKQAKILCIKEGIQAKYSAQDIQIMCMPYFTKDYK